MAKDVSIEFGGELTELKNSLDGMSSYVKGWGDTIKGIGAAAFAFVGAKEAISMGVEFASGALEAAGVQAKLEAVVKATGGAAGFTADQMSDMAMELRKVTQIDDDVIKGAQTVIATFKEIRGDEFERTTQAALDMSAVLGGDLQSSAMQLGKALNDPEKGMMMLAKAGVGFTDQQKEMVKEMIKAGDVAGAQGIILSEMEAQFGGAAAAAAEATGPWATFGFILNDVKDAIGAGLLAVIEPLMPLLEQGADLVSGWAESFSELGPTISEVAGGAIQSLIGYWSILGETATSIMNGIGELWASVFGDSATSMLDSLFGFAKDVFFGLISVGVGYFTAIQVGFQNIPEVASFAWNSIKLGAVTLFEDLKHFFTVTAPEIVRWFADNWRDIFTDIFNFTKTVFSNMWDNIVTFFTGVWDWLSGNEASFEFKGLTEGFESSLKELPQIAERELTGLEKELGAKVGEQGSALAGKFQAKFKENMEALGLGDVDVSKPTANAANAAAATAVAGPNAPDGNAPSRKVGGESDKDKQQKAAFEDFSTLFKRIQTSAASGSNPELKVAEKTANASEKTAAAAEKTAKATEETLRETREMRRERNQGSTGAVWQ